MIHKIDKLETKGTELICTFRTGEIVHWNLRDLLEIDTIMVNPLKEHDFFKKVFLESGCPTWPNGFDLCSEMIFREGKHQK